MKVAVVTLFPAMFGPLLEGGVIARAVRDGRIHFQTVDPRDFATDPHGTVDDRPYGGGPGMVLRVEPWLTAIRHARSLVPAGSPVIFLTPQGAPFKQSEARRLALLPGLVLVAGRYEGFDERLLELAADLELSIGDYVLSGGEIPALTVLDATLRLLPGVLGDAESASADSFEEGLLDHPHYTRPENAADRQVPAVLLGGDHARIRRWRRMQALGRTSRRRPDLLAGRTLSDDDQKLLDEFHSASIHS